jgi:hypothetical protein
MRRLPVAVTRAAPSDRTRDLGLLAVLVVWLVYTRVFWVLQAAHLSAPPCPFYYLTGHPCPFCGGTRSFAYMWRGDLSDAVRLYPLGPALFGGSLVGVGGLAAGVLSGHTWSNLLSRVQWRVLAIGAGSAVAISWALKVFILGN